MDVLRPEATQPKYLAPSTAPLTLLLGFGNPDREDDGVAWHILRALAERFGHPLHHWDESEPDPDAPSPHLMFTLQLVPELVDVLHRYQRVCFIDAHTGAYAEDVHFAPVQPNYHPSPFTHHLTPETCLMLTKATRGHAPEAVAVSVRGHQFGFVCGLTPATQRLAQAAVERILAWLEREAMQCSDVKGGTGDPT